MLTLDPGLMVSMDDEHLLAALESETPLIRTSVELELMRRLADALDILADCPTEDEMEERYVSPLEQSDFRAQLIEEIIALCDRSGSKKELVDSIKSALENSYVEL